MGIFKDEEGTKRALRRALDEARAAWTKASKSGARGLADAGRQAGETWNDVKTHAVDVWQEAKDDAERTFRSALSRAEKSWKSGAARRWNDAARRPMSAFIVLGAVIGAAILLSLFGRDEGDPELE